MVQKVKSIVLQIVGAIVILVLVISIFFLIRFLGMAAWFEHLKISYDFIPLDAIAIIVSAILTIWIGWYIAKKLTEQRYEKEFLIKDLISIEHEILQIEALFKSSTSIDMSFVSSKYNDIQLLFGRLKETMSIMEVSVKTDELSKHLFEIYPLITNMNESPESIDKMDIPRINVVCNSAILSVRALIIRINKI
jgi:cell division protein FtsL